MVLALVALAGLPTAWATPADRPMPEPPTGPVLTFESTVFDFGRVDSGGSITHAFVFRNTGDQVLEITRVQPGCGCTTAGTWDKRVEPGAKGSIPLQFNAAGFSGRVTKTATVHSNDRNHSNVVLQLTGTVWKPVEATPSLVMFSYPEEGQTPQTRDIRIVNHLEEAVTISGIEGTNASFQAVLETVRPGHEYQLHLTATPPFTQRSTVAPIRLTTSAPKVPSLQVTAYALVQPLVAVSPEQLWIPGETPASPIKSTLVIRNSGADPVKLSEPKATVDGPEVVLRESEAGRLYHVDVTFPAGFRLEEGRPVEITVRSSHPKFPLLRIPVLQQPGSRTRKPTDS